MSGYVVDKKDCVHHRIFPGVDIYTTTGQQMMLSLVEMQPHAVVEEHSHPHEQVGLMLAGEADFTIGGEALHVTVGQMWKIPGGVLHKVVAGPQGVRALDVFNPPRADYQ